MILRCQLNNYLLIKIILVFVYLRIFLIDHAYTYRINNIRNELEQLPELVERLSRLMLISSDEENKIDAIIEQMWKYNHTYTLAVDGGNAEDREPYWYIRDEFGSAIEHSDQPNVRMAPFLSMIDGQMYTLLWLIEDIECSGMYELQIFFKLNIFRISYSRLCLWNTR